MPLIASSWPLSNVWHRVKARTEVWTVCILLRPPSSRVQPTRIILWVFANSIWLEHSAPTFPSCPPKAPWEAGCWNLEASDDDGFGNFLRVAALIVTTPQRRAQGRKPFTHGPVKYMRAYDSHMQGYKSIPIVSSPGQLGIPAVDSGVCQILENGVRNEGTSPCLPRILPAVLSLRTGCLPSLNLLKERFLRFHDVTN